MWVPLFLLLLHFNLIVKYASSYFKAKNPLAPCAQWHIRMGYIIYNTCKIPFWWNLLTLPQLPSKILFLPAIIHKLFIDSQN